ncbi:MAG: hypothetical protein DRG78_22170 [Epsilonproteobacteria bacterium]|nr:MAG: hypothetical protein DRG78_22170 [Campylobacterota bacterium]
MVKKIAPYIAYTIFFLVALIYFTPKINFYYFLEAQLEEKGVLISDEVTKDKGYALKVYNANLSYSSIESAEIADIALKIYGVYNSIYLNNITLTTTAKSFIPLHVDNVKVIYSILNPLNIKAYGVGAFGEFYAKFNVLEQTLHVELKPAEIMSVKYKNTLNNFSENEDGELCYDKNF